MIDRSSIRSCAGSAAAVRVAAEIAPILARSDLADSSRDQVVAIDGCASACARRTLEARGLRPLSVSLDQFGVSPDERVRGRGRDALRAGVVERLEAQAVASSQPPGRRRRSSGPSVRGSGRSAHNGNDYLHAIHLLTSPVAVCGALIADAPTVAAHVAAALSVTRASAGEMLGRLEASGLVARGPAKEILLTAAGRQAAGQIVHRHRLVERFLVDVLQYSPPESFRLALEIRDAFPEVVTERFEALTARSAHCPHGWPVDPSRDRDFAAGLVALSTVAEGTEAAVVALIEHDADVLQRLFDRGLAPGVELLVTGTEGQVEIDVDGQRVVLDDDEAASVLVPR